MRHAVGLVAIVLLTLLPATAAAQAPAMPVVEIGGHAGALTAHFLAGTFGPRLTFNLTRDTSFEFAAEFQRQEPDPFGSGYHAAALYHVQLRRRVWHRGRASLSGLVGGGVGHRDYRFTPGPFPPHPGDPQPVYELRDTTSALLAGISAELTVSSRLALRADAQAVFGSSGGVRVVGGASVPLGRYPVWPGAERPAVNPGTALLRDLPPGQRAWVTMSSGREHEGIVRRAGGGVVDLALAASDVSLTLTDVRRIEVPDSIRNGVGWGALAGGAAMGTLATTFALAFCRGSGGDCGDNALGFVLITAAFGAGLGAVGGAIVDSFIGGRRVVYEPSGGR